MPAHFIEADTAMMIYGLKAFRRTDAPAPAPWPIANQPLYLHFVLSSLLRDNTPPLRALRHFTTIQR